VKEPVVVCCYCLDFKRDDKRSEKGEPILKEDEEEERDDHLKIRKGQRK